MSLVSTVGQQGNVRDRFIGSIVVAAAAGKLSGADYLRAGEVVVCCHPPQLPALQTLPTTGGGSSTHKHQTSLLSSEERS